MDKTGTRISAFFLVGPTAVGKSAVAQRIAEDGGLDIVSADSMLVYRGMDIGTAKPSREERDTVRYWCADLVEPKDQFSVGAYREAALTAFRAVAAAGGKAIVAGGTGLYVKALTHGLIATPPINIELRAQLEHILAERGVAALTAMLEKEAPALLAALADKNNPRRVIRAIETARAGIFSPAVTWKAYGTGPRLTGLVSSPATLDRRIKERVRNMYDNGLLDEVQRLNSNNCHCRVSSDAATSEPRSECTLSATARNAIGYAEAIAVLEGGMSREDAIARTTLRTVQLAKRQLTWFRRQSDVDWIDVDNHAGIASIVRAVEESWRKNGPAEIIS